MALEKIVEDDKLEIVTISSWKVLQVRTATIIKDDGVENITNFPFGPEHNIIKN